MQEIVSPTRSPSQHPSIPHPLMSRLIRQNMLLEHLEMVVPVHLFFFRWDPLWSSVLLSCYRFWAPRSVLKIEHRSPGILWSVLPPGTWKVWFGSLMLTLLCTVNSPQTWGQWDSAGPCLGNSRRQFSSFLGIKHRTCLSFLVILVMFCFCFWLLFFFPSRI